MNTPPSNALPVCVNCAFWAKAMYYDRGECRRHAPHANLRVRFPNDGRDNDYASWPNTHEHDWCGDFALDGDRSPVAR